MGTGESSEKYEAPQIDDIEIADDREFVVTAGIISPDPNPGST